MNIIVCIKQVPDTSEVKIDPQTKNLVREGVPSILNPCDANAIEAALRIKESAGGTVTLLSMGPLQAQSALEYGLGMGADRAVLICDRRLMGSDTLATSYALSYVINKDAFDLILCGNESIDGCTGQVGPSIAERLEITAVTYVSDIAVDNGKAIIKRSTNLYHEVAEAELPLLVCMAQGVNEPRVSGMPGAKVEILNADGMDSDKIGLDGSPTRVSEIFMPERAKSFVDIDSSLSCEERIDLIISGGIEQREYKLIRGSAKKLADIICGDKDLYALTVNDGGVIYADN